ncbi:MAG: LuxR C-terminal-related transcriptional regulator [Candidatus Promineifilaceae bacterium]
MAETFPIIQTKLYRPPLQADFVPRPQLIEQLDGWQQRPLTLVSAPAGYGKSMLVSSWLESLDYPAAWLSLDENDNDLELFLNYFLACVQTSFPDAVDGTVALIGGAELPPLRVLSNHLANELNHLPQRLVLVIDDYHVISESNIDALLSELLKHPPRHLHLVVVTRTDPLINLNRLRALGQVTEIRTQQLRFSVMETIEFLEQLLRVEVDKEAAALLEEKTEGWVTGIRLAAMSMRHRENAQEMLRRLSVERRYIWDYLMSEVLSALRLEIQNFLVKTAVLDRFCASLCNAVLADSGAESETPIGTSSAGSQSILDSLQQDNLFIIPLDGQRRWFRYHHLFQQLLTVELKERYNADEIAVFHLKASSWYSQNGLVDEALQHALEAGDDLAAAQLLEENARMLLDEDRWHVLEKWMSRLPDSVIRQRPRLLIAKAWVRFHQFAVQSIPPLLELVGTILEDDATAQQLGGEVDFFWGHHWYWQGQSTRSLDSLNRALEQIPKAHHLARGEAEVFWSLASQMSDQKEEAIRRLNRWLYDEQTPHPGRQTKLLGTLIFIHILSGEFNDAAPMARQLHEMATKNNNRYIRAWTSYIQGYIHYFWNDLDTATRLFAEAVSDRYILHTAGALDSLVGLALTSQALGQPDTVEATVSLLLEFAQENNYPASITVARSCQARLSLMQGDLESAVRWLEKAELATDSGVMFFWLEVPHITQCRILIAQGSKTSLHEAGEKLAVYGKTNKARNNTRQLIDILLLQSLIYQKQSQSDKALAALARAITLAEPGGFIRPFLDLGPEMADLLVRLSQRGVALAYITRILAAFRVSDDGRQTTDENGSVIDRRMSAPASSVVDGRSSELVEPLTPRELDVLALLAQGLTNKEIAQRLVISHGTVRQHAYNLYQKLQVNSRQQAAKKASDLGILFPE